MATRRGSESPPYIQTCLRFADQIQTGASHRRLACQAVAFAQASAVRSGKNYLIFILLCTTLGAGYLAWKQHGELSALRSAVPSERTRAEERRRTWEQRRSEQAKANTAASRTNDGQPPAGQPGNTRRPDGPFFRAIDNPDYQTLMNLTQKGMLDGRYAALFKQLGLTPRQLEQFKELLVEKQTAALDVLAAARSQGLNMRDDRDAVQQLISSTQADLDESIKAALGADGYATYQEFEQSQPTRAVVSQLEQRLSYGSAPLTEAQNRQMVQILAETGQAGGANAVRTATPALRIGGPMAGANPQMGATFAMVTGGGVLITDETVARSQSVLSPAQVAALQEIQQEQQAGAQLGRSIRSELAPRPQPASPAPAPAVPAP